MYYIFTNKPGQKSLIFNPIINSLYFIVVQKYRRDIKTQVIKIKKNNLIFNKKL